MQLFALNCLLQGWLSEGDVLTVTFGLMGNLLI